MFFLVFCMCLMCVTLLFVVVGVRLYDTQRVESVCDLLKQADPPRPYSESMLAGLPKPVQKYFVHSLAPGTMLTGAATLYLRGRMKQQPGRELAPFSARQVLSRYGYVWLGGMPGAILKFFGTELYLSNSSRRLWWLWGILPMGLQSGQPLSQSLAALAVLERIWLPSALLPDRTVSWESLSEHSARASIRLDGSQFELNLTLASNGALESASLKRPLLPAKGQKATEMVYVIRNVSEEKTYAGNTVPTRFQAGWESADGSFEVCYEPEVENILYH